jgi:hypothetical protein
MDEKRLSHPFTVGRVDDGAWLAVSARAPFFCFRGDSCDEVIETANRGLDFFFGQRGIVSAITTTEEKRKKTLSTFRPTKRVNRECESV